VLPQAVAYNRSAVPGAMHRLARALQVTDPAIGLFDLAKDLGATMALRDLGMPGDAIDRTADLALANPYRNPRPLERAPIRDLIAAAYEGRRPTAA
ncbi:MAG TPA: iron-containing alcohol dehydrogenase, partial [Dongiaceae bacterium]